MQMPPKFVLFLRQMKGANLPVLIACWCSDEPLTNYDLQDFTGYNQDTIRNAIRDLVGLGWLQAISSQGPWRLHPDAKLPFPAAIKEHTDARGEDGTESHSSSAGGLVKTSKKHEKIRREWEIWLKEQPAEERERALQLLEVLTASRIKTPTSWQLADRKSVV